MPGTGKNQLCLCFSKDTLCRPGFVGKHEGNTLARPRAEQKIGRGLRKRDAVIEELCIIMCAFLYKEVYIFRDPSWNRPIEIYIEFQEKNAIARCFATQSGHVCLHLMRMNGAAFNSQTFPYVCAYGYVAVICFPTCRYTCIYICTYICIHTFIYIRLE